MAATFVCRHNPAEVVGTAYDKVQSTVLVTVQGDGVTAFDSEQRRTGSYALGPRSTLEFQTAGIRCSLPRGPDQAPRCVVAAVVRDNASNSHSLCSFDDGGSVHCFADAPVRLQLPGPAHSCHVLHRTLHRSGTQETHAAVVLNDGRIGVTDLTAGSTAGPLTVLPAPASFPSPRRTLASSHGDTLVVLTQSAPGSEALLRVLRTTSASQPDSPGLTQIKSLTVPCPGGTALNAAPLGLTLSSTYALVHWSNANATAVHGLPGGATTPLRAVTLPLAEAVSANGAGCSTSAPAQPTTPGPAGTPAAGGKKRKNAGAAATPGPAGGAAAGSGGGGGPRVLCAAVDDGQFLVLDLDSGAARSQVCYSLHDAQFGCPLASGVVEVDAPLLSLQQAQCSVVHADAEATVIRLGGAVHVLHVRTQPVSLLSLVARLSVSASASAAAAAGGAPGSGSASVPAAARGVPAVGGRAVAAALAALPQPVQLDPGLLRAPAPPAPLPANTHAGTIAITAALAAAAADAGEVVVLQPVPATAFSRPADICSSLVEQLSAVQPPAVPSQQLLDSAVSYIAGRRQHGMGIPPQLLSLTAQGLVAAKQWSQLATLLTHITPGGLVDCSSVLVAAAAAQQYALLPRLATCLDEVDPHALVEALATLLAPTTRSNLPERQKHHAALRRTAESLVAAAESAAAAAEGPAPQGRGRGRAAAADPAAALALAQCGAAAVDGWSYREATLHALLAMPVDAPAVQVALKGLPAAAADALLGYLAKWVAKYAGGALGELAAGAVLPQELLFPYYHQVLEWTRMVIDAHLTRLLMARTPLPALEQLEATLGAAVEGARRLALLKGALEHVAARAPLPAAHMAVATQYTAEVLDLRVR